MNESGSYNVFFVPYSTLYADSLFEECVLTNCMEIVIPGLTLSEKDVYMSTNAFRTFLFINTTKYSNTPWFNIEIVVFAESVIRAPKSNVNVSSLHINK